MLLIESLRKKKSGPVPFWFMRQAGRYLPEYKKVRAGFPDFLRFCYTPEAACEVTLQPIARFDMSAAIIFSDILVIPDALGQKVAFKENVGPVLEPLADMGLLNPAAMEERLVPVYEAIRLTRRNLPKEKALIGFCGAPWTLACYMLEGKGSRDFAGARTVWYRQPQKFSALLEMLAQAVSDHACRQIEAGADAIQLFDSWSGVLSEPEFEHHVIAPAKKIAESIRHKYPHVPVIGFPRLCGEKLLRYACHTGVDAVSFDGSVSLDYARDKVGPHVVLQGNLDSILLAEDRQGAVAQTGKILNHFSGRPFIFNLAHGILPHTPIENVQAVSDMIKAHV